MLPAEPVASPQNARLKALRALRAGKERSYTALEGKHLLDEALAVGLCPEWILVEAEVLAAEEALLARATAAGSVLYSCARKLLREQSDLDAAPGLVAWIKRPRLELGAVVATLQPQDWLLVAAGVQDPGNLGALVRVAAGLGAAAFLAVKGGGSPWHPRALRGASGTTFRLPVVEGLDAEALWPALHAAGVETWATAADGEPLSAAVATAAAAPVAWVLGEEGRGLATAWQAQCTRRVGIPLARGVESLNVATAAAICAWALQEARGRPSCGGTA